ncbi:helix-turn-helix domain-containing protein [Micromonospora sp. NPDC047793]|uniref:helix-turn-helix domain-containing protein n=1 Tax=Micromonospora sp. NPDC047793 TaxID=3154342 RepID=UPI0033FC1A92
MVGFTYKTTAIALQNRRLVAVSKKGGVWRAEPTDAGRYYAEHGCHRQRPAPVARPSRYGVPSAATALAVAKKQEAETPPEGRSSERRPVTAAKRPQASRGTTRGTAETDGRITPVRYRVMVSRVQVAERYVRAVDEDGAMRKVQDELNRPYSFIGGWRTVDTDLDVVEAESPLHAAPAPLDEGGSALLSLKQAAAHLGISYGTLWQLVRGGEIDHVEIGSRRYISRDGLKTFIDANTRRGVGYPLR